MILKNYWKPNLFENEKKDIEIYTIYHIETFEGGAKSRLSYLKNIAREFEKENSNVFFYIKNVLPENLQEEINLSTPDLISFGFGVGNTVFNELKPLSSEYQINENYIKSAYYNGKLMCAPYISSGYVYFTNQEEFNFDKLYCGNNQYTHPEKVYSKKTSKINNGKTMSSYEVYQKFAYKQINNMLGTARDLYRIENLNSTGRLTSISQVETEYTDLIQYMGIVNKNSCTLKFLDYLLKNENQSKLKDYGLFSTKNLTLYSSKTYQELEMALANIFVPNVFYV